MFVSMFKDGMMLLNSFLSSINQHWWSSAGNVVWCATVGARNTVISKSNAASLFLNI